MISKGRNILQAQIDDTAIVLDRLLSEVPRQIKASFKELEKIIDEEVVDMPYEEACSVKSSMEAVCRMEDETEMIESFYKSMVIMICSYCERTLLLMLPSETATKGSRKKSKIDFYFRTLKNIYNLKDIGAIDSLWTYKKQFTKLRNEIVHNNDCDTSLLNEDYIKCNLEMVRDMLRSIADVISLKQTSLY